jgi:2-polyprenyl-3-methyl-5-hydroxy-6-metoxy-1,4-benzoquinol methylase
MAQKSTHRSNPAEEANVAVTQSIGRPHMVLDVGCGLGLHGAVARMAGATVVGLERDPAKIERARRLLDEVHEVDPTDADRVAALLGDRRFDLILFTDLFEQVGDPAAILRSYRRFLAPEGHVILSLRNRDSWNVGLNMVGPELGYPEGTGTPEGPRLFRQRDALDMVSSAGLQTLRIVPNPMLARVTRPYIDESFFTSKRRASNGKQTAFTDLPAYRAYLATLRPLEVMIANQAPRWLSYQFVVVAREKPVARPLSLAVGMLTMDEEQSIERIIGEIRRVAPDAKIICVDSSMKDQTPVIAERLGAQVVRQLPPRGHGPAMEVLMYEAAKQSEALIYLDCDFTYPPDEIPKIRKILESGVDVVNAARTRHRPEAMPLPNYVANKTFATLGRITSGARVSDLHSGMRGYRTSVIRAFAFDGEGDAVPIDTLLWPAKCGYRVVEIPIDYQERVGFSKLRKMAGTVWTFVRLAKTLKVGRWAGGKYEVWDSTRDQPED